MAKIKYMSVSGNVLKKIRVGKLDKYFILFFQFFLKCCQMYKCGFVIFIVTLQLILG